MFAAKNWITIEVSQHYVFKKGCKFQSYKCLLLPAQARETRFLDAHRYYLGAYAFKNCAFNPDEIYRVGSKLSIWLRHTFLQCCSRAAVDSGGWAAMDVILDD